jgi:gamma-glutamyltranspeptidase/glutathione hydrolase
MSKMKFFFSLVAGMLVSFLSFSQDRVSGKSFTTRSEVIAQNGMVATAQPLATQVALDILKKGGSAMDAAIAANAMLGLVEPNGCGIGGDVFAIIWDAKTKKLYGFNGSGRAPELLTMDVFKEKGLSYVPLLGPLPVSVPGCVDGWFEMHKRFGKLSMQEILQPSIDYANTGFPVTEVIAWQMNGAYPQMQDIPGFRKTFMPNGKNTPKKGDFFTFKIILEKSESL